MTAESQPRHPLALLDLLIRVNAAAQHPGEEHEDLAEQFTQVMADPATGEQLRALRAQAEAEAGLREAARQVAEASSSVRFQEDVLRMGVLPYDTIPEQEAQLRAAHDALWAHLEALEQVLGIDPFALAQAGGES